MGLGPLEQSPEVPQLAEHGDDVHRGRAVSHQFFAIAWLLNLDGCSYLKTYIKRIEREVRRRWRDTKSFFQLDTLSKTKNHLIIRLANVITSIFNLQILLDLKFYLCVESKKEFWWSHRASAEKSLLWSKAQ